MPHTIAVPVYSGLSSFEYASAREILGRDRRDLTSDWYRFVPCRIDDGPILTSHGLMLEPAGHLHDLETADTILVTGWSDLAKTPPRPLLDAVRGAHQRGKRIVSICTGAFVLGHAGILDGKVATTHWMHSEIFKSAFPQVNFTDQAIYSRDDSGPGTVLSSAGSAAGLDLCLAMIRDDFGVAIASAVARRMVAPVHREGGQAQFIEAPSAVSDDEAFGPILEWLNERLTGPIDLEEAARAHGFSSRTFHRRFKQITHYSPHQWLTQQRLARARELLESTSLSVERIAGDSGLGSAANLRKQLRRYLDTTPRAYRSAFQCRKVRCEEDDDESSPQPSAG